MLTREENELLTRTGPGTLMGDLFRRFWIPAVLSEELPGPDSPQVRVTLLGEKLVAFRDSHGKVGLLERYCPHRRADLFYGRNEEGGLRCVYHGWKFDVEGHCLDIPNARVGQAFKDKCKAQSYPTVEKGGMVWAYLGPREHMPELPHYEFLQVPPSHYYVSKFRAEGNYLQSLEGEADSGHATFLHRYLQGEGVSASSAGGLPYVSRVGIVNWEVEETDYGLMMAARRDIGDGRANWRANLFLMPHTVPVATVRGTTMTCHIRVPIDDESSWVYRPRCNPGRPLTEAERASFKHGGEDYPELIPGTYLPKENKSNDYLLDRAAQRRFSYTGIRALTAQDMAVQSDQDGVIAARTRENLTSSDKAIIVLRQKLLKAARDLRAGKEPPEARRPEKYNVRAMDVVLSMEADWKREMEAAMSHSIPWVAGAVEAGPQPEKAKASYA
jgi:phthalate 4,5-dioxygenase oxygenase subunit